MISGVLYRREMKNSLKMLVIFAAILSMYISMIISMYDPEKADVLKQFEQMMPELMAAVGMQNTSSTLIGFMSSYLYGMLLLVFPMVYTMMRANGLIAKYVDRGSMAVLVTGSVHRCTVVLTQTAVLCSGIFLLLFYCTALEFAVAEMLFPGQLLLADLLRMNLGLLALQLFIGGLCFLCSCLFNDTRYSIGFGAGIPTFLYIVQMIANLGGNAENAKYFTFFTLYQPDALAGGDSQAVLCAWILLAGAVLFFAASAVIFEKKYLPV